jgi:hypothetical protein
LDHAIKSEMKKPPPLLLAASSPVKTVTIPVSPAYNAITVQLMSDKPDKGSDRSGFCGVGHDLEQPTSK